MSKKKKIFIALGIFISLIVIWRVNAMMNTKLVDPNKMNDHLTSKEWSDRRELKNKEGMKND